MAPGLVFSALFCLSGGLWIGAEVGSGFSHADQHDLNSDCTKRAITCDDLYNVQRLSCETGVIVVKSALYGRTNQSTCSAGRPEGQLANTNCSQKGTVEIFKTRCDGKAACEVNTNVVRLSDPCYGIYKYIDTVYQCVQAVQTVACESSLANLQCDSGKVIEVIGADYGRTDPTTCSFQRPAAQVQNTQCSSPSSHVADSCNGKTSCVVSASNSVFGDPCVGTYKYLQVAYVCK